MYAVVGIYITTQQEPFFLLSLSLTSSSAFDGTRHRMCTVVTLSGPDAKLYSVSEHRTKQGKKRDNQQQAVIRAQRHRISQFLRASTTTYASSKVMETPPSIAVYAARRVYGNNSTSVHNTLHLPFRVFGSSRSFPKCKIRISSTFEGGGTPPGGVTFKKSRSSGHFKGTHMHDNINNVNTRAQ